MTDLTDDQLTRDCVALRDWLREQFNLAHHHVAVEADLFAIRVDTRCHTLRGR